MARSASKFVCQQCGYSQVGWAGRCPNCDSWGSLVETVEKISSTRQKSFGHSGRRASSRGGDAVEMVELAKVKGAGLVRISTGIPELDNVLGGGLVGGQVVLFAGEPGIGKSTLTAQIADKIYPSASSGQAPSTGSTSLRTSSLKTDPTRKIIYVAGEESASQIQLRTKRLGIKGDGILILEETDTDEVIDRMLTSYSLKNWEVGGGKLDNEVGSGKDSSHITPLGLIIVDSIQTLTTGDLSGTAGSVGQVRESAGRLAGFAKRSGIPLILVGHVTKEGTIAGPRVLEHMVDTVLWFEGERRDSLRILRSVKNRFGPTDEVGIFNMTDTGLVPVEDPSTIFSSVVKNVPGQVRTVILEGTRPIILEIQALVAPTKLPYPKRVVQGIDPRRVEVILAVLSRRFNIPLFNFDVFVNVAGGIAVREPAADLAIGLAIASAWSNKPVAPGAVAFGEVGLLGEIRAVAQEPRRAREAKRLGAKVVINHDGNKTIGEAIKKYLR